VQESIHDEVIASLSAAFGTLRVGDRWTRKNHDIGAINSASSWPASAS
jgi:acyl-CoA reductase-like NAD-dependent aldehyde dehydrogenase